MEYNLKNASANVIFGDYPDPDIIRVGETYYMVSTTMHFMPGCVILRSYNLVDWEIASYVYDELDGTPGQRLFDGKGVYGQGMWAGCIRFYNDKFYVTFIANDTHKTYLYTADTVEGPWKKSEIKGFYHDMSLLFDDDGRVYVVSGNTNINLTELESDLSGPKAGGVNKTIIKEENDVILGYEGSHIYKINGKYYIFFIHWPKGKYRTEACFVSDKIDGPYTGCDVLNSDLGNWFSGVAQGGIVETPDGKWFGMLFQDHGALGRIPVLVPVKWENDFPVFGVASRGKQVAPPKVNVPDLRPDYEYKPLWNDDFTGADGKLCETWQWNHTPDKRYYRLENNKLEITNGTVVRNVHQAVNTLTQRPLTEKFSAQVTVDASAINDGDFAGLCALEGDYGFIAVTKEGGKLQLVTGERNSEVQPFKVGSIETDYAKITASKDAPDAVVAFRVDFDFGRNRENAKFFYMNACGEWEQLGNAKKLRFTLDQFVGCRFSLFNFATKETGGKALFKDVKSSYSK